MIKGLNIDFKLKKISLLIRDVTNNLRNRKLGNIFYLGLVIHLFGWGMPYLYIILVTNLLDLTYRIIFVSLLIAGLIYIAYRSFFMKSNLFIDKVEFEKCVIVENERRVSLWKIYDDAFASANKKSPCRQSYHFDEFMAIMVKTDVVKYILKKDKKDIGLAMLTTNLKNSSWISEDYFKNNYPDKFQSNKLFYFLGIVLTNEYRRRRFALNCLNYIFSDLPKDIIVGFDHSSAINKHIGKFPLLLNMYYGVNLKRYYLDSMNYYVVKIGNVND